MESGDYRGSSWISISRDSLENSQSLGHINIYPRSPYSPTVMIYIFFLLDDYYFISFTYPKFFLLFIFSRIHMIRIFLLWNIREVLFYLFYSFRSVSFTYIALRIQQPIPNWFWNSGFVDSELVVEFGEQDICLLALHFY